MITSDSLRNLRKIDLIATGLFLALLSLAGCRSLSLVSPQATVSLPPTEAVGIAHAQMIASPTPVVALISDAPAPMYLPFLASPTPALEPLRFTFPTAEAEPATLWRPPLYPLPWEPTPYDHFYFARPIGANEVNWPLARYRYGGVFFANAHTGIDIPAPKGTPVQAAGPGEVIWAGYGLSFLQEEYRDAYGIAVAIKHDYGYRGQMLYTVYAHMDTAYVIRGQRVETGDLIGLVGETGKVTGPHLHFEVRLGDNRYFGSRNPELWIAPPQGWGVLVGRVMNSAGILVQRQMVELRNLDTNQYAYVHSYGEGPVNSDEYYQENVVLGDLPAGPYYVWIDFESVLYKTYLDIEAGRVTYFTFWGREGFDTTPLPTPAPNFESPDASVTPAP
ncbi:MAG: M23 family metallopeptidase [Anaerolineales bacterium]|nr:M23 family metallopeptidase [Anaerolineales bacterium]